MSDQQMATHARVIRLKGEPARTDEVIKRWTNEILPLLKRQEGFRGASLVGNRKTGDGFSVTYWESERAMQNARPQVRPQAEEILNATGGKIVDDDECEVAVQERIQPAKAGVFTPRDDGRSRSSQGCRRHRALQGEGRSSDPSAGRRPHGAPFRESEVRPDHLRERLGHREGSPEERGGRHRPSR